MSFSQDIKQSNTDEWYTTKECVELIIPFLLRGGGITRYCAHLTKIAVNMSEC